MKRLCAAVLSAFVLLAVLSCQKDKSDVWVMATPLTSVILPADPEVPESVEAKGFRADTDVFFDIEIISTHGALASLEGSVSDPVNGSKSFLQMELSEKSFKGQVLYHTPATDVALKQVFTFKAVDAQGYTGKYATSVYVCPASGALLKEQTALSLVCGNSNDHNAFSFTTGQTLFYQRPEESEEAEAATSVADIVLEEYDGGLRLFTATDIKFVRNSSFDYSQATATGVRNVYLNSTRSDFVPSVLADDIILIGRMSESGQVEAVGVLKIIVKEEKRIVFNLKRIE